MARPSPEKLYATTLQTIGAVAKLPVVRVDREEFLRTQFAGHDRLDEIVADGPQAVVPVAVLRERAGELIASSTNKTSLVSFASGVPGNPIVMVAAGGADVVQYFGFALHLAQQIAYLFGEDDLFDGGSELSEAAQVRVIAYLGVMLGAAGAAALVTKTSQRVGVNLGKKVAAQALTQSTWYPLLRKVGALVGKKITKQTVERTIAKGVPILGGVISGGLTYVTFRPMGYRLADTLAEHLSSTDRHLTSRTADAGAPEVVPGVVVDTD